VDERGSEGGPVRVSLGSKLSVAMQMGQTRGPAFLVSRWVANLAWFSLYSITSENYIDETNAPTLTVVALK